MKNYFKLIAMFLAVIMLVSAFSACGNGSEVTDDSSDNGSVENTDDREYRPDIEKNNYNEEFFFWIMGDSNPIESYWVEESKNDALSEAIYNRQEEVRKYLGVEIIGSDTEDENRYVQPFKNAVQIKDGSVDLLVSHVYYGIDGFITGNYLMDFNEISEINLNADYWKIDFMEDIGINGHLYLGFSDLNILYTHVITFNKELFAKYEDQFEEDLYEMVENYHWTLDQMISVASLGYVDVMSDGKTDDDQYGIVGYQSVPFIGFMQASNINIIEADEKGNYGISFYNETNKQKMSDLCDKIKNLALSDCAYFTTGDHDYSYPQMTSGRALFEVSGTPWLKGYLSSGVEFGVLPFPMFNEDQKNVGYRSLQWGGYLCVPSYMGEGNRPQMIGETIEMMSYYSDNVATAYYEKLLGKQIADAPEDRKMFDLIWDSVCSDVGQTYYSAVYDTKVLYVLPTVTKKDSTTNLSSFVGGCETSVKNAFKKFIRNVK